ncbi:MAG: phospholipase D-like domain-containing protein [Desulfobacterales bacterium]|jgi:phosphatidylserine/phosphatidylglycerophosphate/cardiolipin synthase-like enzyme|nr:phospholipase D-like domain-containing protein [Desulfobacterales bacterium]
MNTSSVGVSAARVTLLPDDAYAAAIKNAIQRAYRRVLCSVFIVDLNPGRDPDLMIDSLLVELSAAKWRGADVRLLIGGSRTNFDIAQLGISARARAQSLGIACRALMAAPVRGSHVKLVVTDDVVHLGSHNWSPGSFTNQIQDSVAIASEAMAAIMAEYFELQWKRAEVRP